MLQIIRPLTGTVIIWLTFFFIQKVKAIFAPEHGFRGDVEGGLHLEDNIDPQTRAPIYSLY
ncbi:MAG: DUF1343 domain-containing protein, partial [Fidelibacterota bacterium]